MANRRTRFKDYKGYMIIRVNGYRYYATKIDNASISYNSYDLKELKKIIDCANEV